MAVLQTLSPSLFGVLIEQAAQGHVKPANLVNNVQANVALSYKDRSANFIKTRPGFYKVSFMLDNEPYEEHEASSPVECKLMVLDYLIEGAKSAA